MLVFQRYRTPSRSRSRSVTPVHWKKEEARVIKLAEFEKHEADRKHREEKIKEKQHSKEKNTDGVSEKDESNVDDGSKKEVDYNALDYEDANQSEEEQDTTKKVSSLVQYPINVTSNANGTQLEKPLQESDFVANKRSDALAMALGVQVKTGEDPPDGEIHISGYKRRSSQAENETVVEEIQEIRVVNSKLEKPPSTEQEQKSTERNKFNVEKPVPYQQFAGNRRMDRRDRFYNRQPPTSRFYRGGRPQRFDDRRIRRSPPPRRPNRYNRSRSRDRHARRRSRSVERKRSRSVEKSRQETEKTKEKDNKEKDEQKEKTETDAEKFKRRTEQLLLLKKKMEMEMLEMQKKQEQTQEKKVQ